MEVWLSCPVCRAGEVRVRFEIEEGEPATRHYPGSMAVAHIREITGRRYCGGELGEEYVAHRITDRDVDRMEERGQDRMMEHAAPPRP